MLTRHWHLVKHPVYLNRLPGASHSPYVRRGAIGHLARRLAVAHKDYQRGTLTLSIVDAPVETVNQPPTAPMRFKAAIPYLAAHMTLTLSGGYTEPAPCEIGVAFNRMSDGVFQADDLPLETHRPLPRSFTLRDFDEAWLLACQLSWLLKITWIELGDEGHPL